MRIDPGRRGAPLPDLLVDRGAGLAAAVSLPLLRLAARAVGPRRENLALVAQGR